MKIFYRFNKSIRNQKISRKMVGFLFFVVFNI